MGCGKQNKRKLDPMGGTHSSPIDHPSESSTATAATATAATTTTTTTTTTEATAALVAHASQRPRSVSNLSEDYDYDDDDDGHRPAAQKNRHHHHLSSMPVVWHEPKKRIGNAWKTDRSRIPPKPVWPGLDHNGRPIDETSDMDTTNPKAVGAELQLTANADTGNDTPGIETTATTSAMIPPLPPRPRSRKRKKQVPAVWKEIIDKGGSDSAKKLPTDLQGDKDDGENDDDGDPQKRHKTDKTLPPTSSESVIPPPSSCSHHHQHNPANQPVEIKGLSLSSPSVAPPTNNDVLNGYLPTMAKGITHIQSMLGRLISSGVSLATVEEGAANDATTTGSTATIASGMGKSISNHHYSTSMDVILSRMEAVASRHEANHLQLLQAKEERIHTLDARVESLESSLQEQQALAQSQQDEYIQRIQVLEKKAGQRDNVITELQRAQEQERKESQNRVTEALQKIEQLQDQNEKLMRRHTRLKAVKEEYDRQRATGTWRRSTTAAASTTADVDSQQQQPQVQGQQSHGFLARKNMHNATNRGGVASTMKRKKRSSSLDDEQDSILQRGSHQQGIGGGGGGGGGGVRSKKTSSRSPPTAATLRVDQACDSSVDSFGTPKSRNSHGDGQHSDSSPFSFGSTNSSTEAAAAAAGARLSNSKNYKKPTSIIPGNTIVPQQGGGTPKQGNRRFQMKANIRDLIPNYALDSLARGRSSSTG